MEVVCQNDLYPRYGDRVPTAPDQPASPGERAAARRIGIKDVAVAAGVSTTTVSHVYNAKGKVSTATRDRVLATGRRLGYRPDPLGRALRSGRSRVIGIVVTHLGTPIWERTYQPWFRAIIAGAAIEAVEHGYAVAAVPAPPPGAAAGGDGVDGVDRGPLDTPVPLDGVIVVDPGVDDPLVPWCLEHYAGVVTDGAYLGADEATRPPYVTLDTRTGVPAMLAHLQERHTGPLPYAPALLIGSRMDAYSLGTVSTYTQWCLERRLAVQVAQVGPGENAVDAARRLIADGAATAVHCLNESYAVAALTARDEAGAEAFQVSTVGDAGSATALEHAAYLSVDPARSGATAVRMLIALLDGERVESTVVPVELVPARGVGSVPRS